MERHQAYSGELSIDPGDVVALRKVVTTEIATGEHCPSLGKDGVYSSDYEEGGKENC